MLIARMTLLLKHRLAYRGGGGAIGIIGSTAAANNSIDSVAVTNIFSRRQQRVVIP